MRQVFSSPRLENVEGIAKFLEEHDIEVRITQGRSYKGGWSGRRTYRDTDGGPQPAVWVIRSEDQPKARQLLREAGLLGSTRAAPDSYLAPSVHEPFEPRLATPQRRAFRYKIGLLVAIGIAVALAYSVMRKPRAPQSPASAETLAAAEFDAHDVKAACIAIDGKPAPQEVAARLARPGLAVTPCAPATGGPLVIEVGNYLTDGSGEGTVELAVSSPDASGRPTTQIRTLQVRRVESDWHVLRVLSVR